MLGEKYFNRRGFLKRSLATFGGAFLSGWVPNLTLSSNQIPLVVPRGSLSESGLSALEMGINSGFDGQKILNTQIVETSLTELSVAFERMLVSGDWKIGIAYLTNQQAAWIKPVVESYGKPLIVINAGENIVDPQLTSPFFHFVDLGLSRAAYYLGRWSAANLGKTCAILTEPQLSGFDYLFAFRSGFEKSGGVVNYLEFLSSAADLSGKYLTFGKDTDFVFTNLSEENQKVVSGLEINCVSVTDALMGLDGAFSVQTWGKNHPLEYLGKQTASIARSGINDKSNSSGGLLENEENVLYVPGERKLYHKSLVVKDDVVLETLCQAVADPVIFANLSAQRCQVNQPFYL